MPKVLLRFYNIFVSIICNSWMSASAFAQFSPGFALTSAHLVAFAQRRLWCRSSLAIASSAWLILLICMEYDLWLNFCGTNNIVFPGSLQTLYRCEYQSFVKLCTQFYHIVGSSTLFWEVRYHCQPFLH